MRLIDVSNKVIISNCTIESTTKQYTIFCDDLELNNVNMKATNTDADWELLSISND